MGKSKKKKAKRRKAAKRQYTRSPDRAEAWRQRREEVLATYEAVSKRFDPGQIGAIAELGRELGLSRERARQLLREAQAMD
jgi:hypothetical protein